jgi:hypothetical protein
MCVHIRHAFDVKKRSLARLRVFYNSLKRIVLNERKSECLSGFESESERDGVD